jgi:hypothetical protein
MIVYLEPASGTAKGSLERARAEMERVVGFRGKVTDAKAEGKRIAVTIEINPKWDLPEPRRLSQLKLWIKGKTRKLFTVEAIE